MESWVVPLNEEVIILLYPSNLLIKVDLPVLGFPMKVILIEDFLLELFSSIFLSEFNIGLLTSFFILSYNSSTPIPWTAEKGIGSPKPSDQPSETLYFEFNFSDLLPNKITILLYFFKNLEILVSSEVMPIFASNIIIIKFAFLIWS